MQFLKSYKKGGDKADKVRKMKDPVYLSNRCHYDMDAEVISAGVKQSNNPSKKGKEFFIMEVKPVKFHDLKNPESQATEKGAKEAGARQLEVDKVTTVYIDLEPANEFRKEYAFEEFVRHVAAAAGIDGDDLLEDIVSTPEGKPSQLEKLLVDDFAAGQGRLVRLHTNDDKEKGYYKMLASVIDDQ